MRSEGYRSSLAWRGYRLFGLTMASDFPFATSLGADDGEPDLVFSCIDDAPERIVWDRHSPLYRSPYRTAAGEPTLTAYRFTDLDVLRFTGEADFYLYPDRILCHLLASDAAYSVEISLLGIVLSFWLERRRIPMLHTAAVAVDGCAIGFLASNKGGKSSLAATFMQVGYPLLTDDILPIEEGHGGFLGRPGYPSMRFWPEEAQYFLGHYETLARVHPDLAKRRIALSQEGLGRFSDDSLPIACLYIPERRDPALAGTAIEITPYPPVHAVIELVRHSFIARLAQGVGWQPRRLETFARLLGQAPLRRLVYPSGFEFLPEVREAILKDRASWALATG